MLRLTASVLVLALAACAPPDAPAEPPLTEADAVVETEGADAAPATAAQEPEGFQLSYKLESENYAVSSEIDPAILAFDPPLAWRLWTQAKDQLDALGASADADQKTAEEDATEGGSNWFRGYSLDITHKATGVFGDVISVSDDLSTYTGGAHPLYVVAGGVYRKGETDPLKLSAFVTDETVFDELVVKSLVAQKVERGYIESEAASIEAEVREMLAPSAEIPDIYEGRFVLEESSEAGKVGGISVLFSPYDVGSYAEGTYTVTLSAAELAPILTESWADRFGGEPVVDAEAP